MWCHINSIFALYLEESFSFKAGRASLSFPTNLNLNFHYILHDIISFGSTTWHLIYLHNLLRVGGLGMTKTFCLKCELLELLMVMEAAVVPFSTATFFLMEFAL